MRTLRRGDNNETVRKLQELLGIHPTVANFGPKTEAAVKEFQKRNGLKDDGIVGPETWNKILQVKAQNSNVLNIQNLKGHIPDNVLYQIPQTIEKFELDNPLRLAHFLAQCSHESNEFRAVVENLNYSARGLRTIFRRYFPTDEMANRYQRKPEMIANIVYANRMANGDTESGDGWRFRGRGYIQLTGRANYQAFNQFVDDDVVQNPDLVATKYPLLSAGWFFHRNGIHRIADGGSDVGTIERVTRRVNGGLNGIGHRISEFKKYYDLLTR